ncbi:hypothetical protein DV737_g2185, partial [Chaetothyriales sp. CBS 132003]
MAATVEAPATGLLNLEKDLICFICTEVLHRPLTLINCLHTFCGSCLKEWFSHQHQKACRSHHPPAQPYTCPTCRDSVKDARRNALINTLLESFLMANPSKNRTEEERLEMDKLYMPGHDIMPKVEPRRRRRRDDGGTAQRERGMPEESRERGTRDTRARPPSANDSLAPGHADHRSRSREHDERRDRRIHEREERRQRRERLEVPESSTRDSSRDEHSDGGPVISPPPTSIRHPDAVAARRDVRSMAHQAGLRSIASASDLGTGTSDSLTEERLVQEIISDGLLDGIDVGNLTEAERDVLFEAISNCPLNSQSSHWIFKIFKSKKPIGYHGPTAHTAVIQSARDEGRDPQGSPGFRMSMAGALPLGCDITHTQLPEMQHQILLLNFLLNCTLGEVPFMIHRARYQATGVPTLNRALKFAHQRCRAQVPVTAAGFKLMAHLEQTLRLEQPRHLRSPRYSPTPHLESMALQRRISSLRELARRLQNPSAQGASSATPERKCSTRVAGTQPRSFHWQFGNINDGPGDYDICTTCYYNLVKAGRIKREDGPAGWRKCLQGHRMIITSFEADTDSELRRIVVQDLVGGVKMQDEDIAAWSVAMTRQEGPVMTPARVREWTWYDPADPAADPASTHRRMKTHQTAFAPQYLGGTGTPNDTATSVIGSSTRTTKFPPDGGFGKTCVALWSYYPEEGEAGKGELAFPKYATIKEVEHINEDWKRTGAIADGLIDLVIGFAVVVVGVAVVDQHADIAVQEG